MAATRKIQDLTENIRFGINQNRTTPGADIHFLQGREVDEHYRVNWDSTKRISSWNNEEKNLLEKGDVLFAAKGVRNFTVALEELPEKAVASSSFIVLKPDVEVIAPGFLALYLNSDNAMHYFKRFMRQTTVKMIGKKELLELEVPVPELAFQKKLIRMVKEMRKEKHLLYQLMAKREEVLEGVFHDLAG